VRGLTDSLRLLQAHRILLGEPHEAAQSRDVAGLKLAGDDAQSARARNAALEVFPSPLRRVEGFFSSFMGAFAVGEMYGPAAARWPSLYRQGIARSPGSAYPWEPSLGKESLARLTHMAEATVTGVLHGNTITLDAPVPPLEGQRVRVLIALDDQDLTLVAEEQARLWDEWAQRNPQGPLEDDGEPEFP
jgi:hypothetical protein